MTLRRQVALLCAVLTAVLGIVASVAAGRLIEQDLRRDLDAELETEFDDFGPLAQRIIRRQGVGGQVAAEALAPSIGAQFEGTDGEPIRIGFKSESIFSTTYGQTFRTEDIKGQNWRILTKSTPQSGVVQVGTPLDQVESTVATVRRRMLAVALLSALGAGFAGALAGSRLTRPLRDLQETANSVARIDDLEHRVPVSGPTEIAELAADINRMLGRIETESETASNALAASRSFGSTLSHELRTPLTSMQADLDVLKRHEDLPSQDRADILTSLFARRSEIIELLDALHVLARSEVKDRSLWSECSLTDLAEQVVAAGSKEFETTQFSLDYRDDLPTANVWADGLRVALVNLLSNAAKHGAMNARMELAADGQNRLQIMVEDDGPGISPELRSEVTKRFVKGPDSRGSGLGLALVAQQAELHGSKLKIEDSPLGGVRFRFSVDV